MPADVDCQSARACLENLICAADLHCRAACQNATDCLSGQFCVGGVCADSTDVDTNGQLQQKGVVGAACVLDSDCDSPLSCILNRCHYLCQNTNACLTGQSCIRTATGTVCQLPTEVGCDMATPCSGGLLCAVDYRCRASCKSAIDCTPGQSCAGGVCADKTDLDPSGSGQLSPKNPPAKPDGGTDAMRSDSEGKDAQSITSSLEVGGTNPPDADAGGIRDSAQSDSPGSGGSMSTGGSSGASDSGTTGPIGSGGAMSTGGSGDPRDSRVPEVAADRMDAATVAADVPIVPDASADVADTAIAEADLSVTSPDTGDGIATDVGGLEGRADASADLAGTKIPDAGAPPSCSGLAATCGSSGEDPCCASLLVPGGMFDRSYDSVDFTDATYPATVDDFYLDKYEVTVGRFRQFVNAGMGTQKSPPAAGAGVHPRIPGSGWDSTWDANLPADTASLKAAMKCGAETWTDGEGSNESKPVNCLDWYRAFAFCAWDGGRLPTEAEWNYAASGGDEQRYYPWSFPPTSTTIDDSYAVYCGGSCSGTQNVGSRSPKGDGKWGQADLAGNVWEWMLDWYATPYSMPCDNCAYLASSAVRVMRGGGYSFGNPASLLRSASRYTMAPVDTNYSVGVRCVRPSL
jgi:formylglycine-generating enzyme required for sulfatase activity